MVINFSKLSNFFHLAIGCLYPFRGINPLHKPVPGINCEGIPRSHAKKKKAGAQ